MRLTLVTTYGESHSLPVELFGFPGGERHVRLGNPELSRAYIDYCIINMRATCAADLVDLLFVHDAVKRLIPGIQLELILPYFPGARQDRVAVRGECLTAAVIANIINSLNFRSVECWDLHSDVSRALINNLKEVPASFFVCEVMRKHISGACILVSPDAGARKRVEECAPYISALCQIITCSKKRDPVTGDITGTIVEKLPFMSSKFLIIDDICDGGRTFIEIAKKIREDFKPFEGILSPWIGLYVTHGIFSKGMEVFDDIDMIYSPNPFGWKTYRDPAFFPDKFVKL